MKSIITGIAVLACCAHTYAQTLDATQPGVTLRQITAVAAAHLSTTDTGEGGDQDKFRFYQTFWGGRAVVNDTSGHTMFQQYYHEMARAMEARRDAGCSGGGFTGNWQAFGPDSMPSYQKIGKIECLWADPNAGDTIKKR